LDNLHSRKTVAGLIAVRGESKVFDSWDTWVVGEREQLLLPQCGVVGVSNDQSFLGRQTTSLSLRFRQDCGHQK
jgi:hypothetical protein